MESIVPAKRLDLWANSLDGESELPWLVAALIRASCPSLQSYRFPHADASRTHGFDGEAFVDEGNVFVPKGRSIWELGTGKDCKSKADSDYEKRTGQLSAAERSKISFVFVTSRIWDTGRKEWVDKRTTDGWNDVRLYDAIELEHWLSECPSVAFPLARRLDIIPSSGVKSLEQFWEEYAPRFVPELKAELLLMGRDERAKRICEALSSGLPDLSKLQADSPNEAIAFVAAAIFKADPETSDFLRAKTLILETSEAAQLMPRGSSFNFILPPAASQMGAALARKNQVILALGGDDQAPGSELLERMNTRDFTAGLQSMGIQPNEAFRLAGVCGRSVTVLSRLISNGRIEPPEWHQDQKLVPLVLAGGWDASNEHDCRVVANLCNTPYENVDTEARRLFSLPDSPLDLEGNVWTLRSPKDSFTLTGNLVGAGLCQRLREACLEVFSERDRTLDVPENKRPIIPTRGEDFLHSEWLRRGLARTMLLISGLHQAARLRLIGSTPGEYVENIVGSIPGLSNDVRVIASLKSDFPLLMEAAPRPLASALEQVLGGENNEWIEVIFQDKKDSSILSSASPHTYLLWGLETLAWSPQYLHRAASTLLTLAEFDPGGKLANRPLASLREIFLAWRPNTYASLGERLAVLRSICHKRPSIGLKLVMSLLRRGHDFSSNTAKPRIGDFGESTSTPVTLTEMDEAYRQYANFAVDLAATDIRSLTDLVPGLAQLEPHTRMRAIDAIRANATKASPDELFKLWSKLNTLVQHHQSFQDANWALKPDQLGPLELLCKEIEPRDPVRQILWLFDEVAPRAGSSSGADFLEEANRERRNAVDTLLRTDGISVVLALAKATKNPQFVGYALAQSTSDLEVLKGAISLSIAAESGVDPDFAASLSGAAHSLFGPSWDEWLREFVAGLNSKTGAGLFFRWQDERATWEFIASIGAELDREYWSEKRAFRQSIREDVEFAFDKYVAVGRFSAILDMVAYHESDLSTSKCMEALAGLAIELSKDPRKLQHVHYEIIHMIEDLQKRDDADPEKLAAVEYQYLPLMDFNAEPRALNRLLGKSPELFVSVISDAYKPASGINVEITDERRARARQAYQLLQSIKSVPGFSGTEHNAEYLRSWVTEVRKLASEADRAVITDQQVGQILAYAPTDKEDEGWPAKAIRDLVEVLASDQIELGISVSRFNQRGAFSKAMYDGGTQERGLADQYRKWAELARDWPRTQALLLRIAQDWDAHATRMDTEANLDQLRDRE